MQVGNQVSLSADGKHSEVILAGDQTDQTIEQVVRDILPINDQLSNSGGKVCGIIDVSAMGKLDIHARALAARGLHITSFDKLAVVGASEANRQLIELIIGLSGKQSLAKLFDSRAEAEKWLG